jgi:hypothetical protein
MQVLIKDSFEITNRLMPSSYPPGLVVVFDWTENDDLLPVVGETVNLVAPGGVAMQATVGEIKHHGTGRSFYFASVNKSQGLPGSAISWTPRPVGPRVVDDLGRVIVSQSGVHVVK